MATLTQDVKQLVQEKAKAIRVSIVQSVTAAKSGHPGGSLPMRANALPYASRVALPIIVPP